MNWRVLLPPALLSLLRRLRRLQRRRALQARKRAGNILTASQLAQELRSAGIQPSTSLLVHTALSKVGYLEEGPKTLIEALEQALGPQGTLLMPSSPVKALQRDHARSNPVFDVRQTPSAMGAATEYFRTLPGVERSLHPTEPVCARGPRAAHFTQDHFGEPTPYTANSPWGKLAREGGQILYLGVTLANAGTSLHTLEDALDVQLPVYTDEVFELEVVDASGVSRTMKTRVHNPAQSALRRCDELIPRFEQEGVLKRIRIGEADCLLLDAGLMFSVMLDGFRSKGITMYNPLGR